MTDRLHATQLLRSRTWRLPGEQKRLALLAAVASGLIAAMIAVSLQLLSDLERQGNLVTHSLAVQRQAEQVQTEVRGAGRQVLDFLASGDVATGQPLSEWRDRVLTQAADLRALVADNALQASRTEALQTALQTHLSYLARLQDDSGQERLRLLGARRASAERLEDQISALISEESRLLVIREQAWRRALTRQAVSVVLLGTLALAALGGLLWMWRTVMAERAQTLAAEQSHAAVLVNLNAGLEAQVHERTAKLENTAAALTEAREHLARLAREMLIVSEAERRALAHALHDDFGQRLAALKINLQVMCKRHGIQDSLSVEAIRITEGCIEQVRSQAFALRPPQLDELGLATALQAHVQQEASRFGIAAGVRVVTFEHPPDDAWAIQVYRIVQESVRNAITHGRPQRIELDLHPEGETMVLRICDDGIGPASTGGGVGMGQLHMRERAELSGGRCAMLARIPHGTEVRCEWPLDVVLCGVARAGGS